MRPLMSHLALMLFAPALAAAGPFDPVMVPPEADWVVHLDLETARKTSMGSFLQTRIEGAAEAQLDQLSSKFGMHPFTDIHSVTVYGDASDEKRTAAIAITSIVADRLGEELEKAKISDLSITRVSDSTFLKWRDGQTSWRAAVLTLSHDRRALVFAHRAEELESAIGRISAKSAGVATTSSWEVLPESGSILFCLVKEMPQTPSGVPEAQILKSTRALHLDVGESPQADVYLNLTIDAGRPQDAMAIREMFGGLLALGRVSCRSNPSLQSKVDAASAGVQMQVEGKRFVLGTRQAAGDIIGIIEEAGPLRFGEPAKTPEKAGPPQAPRTGDEPPR